MVYRKGERPIEKTIIPYDDNHPVAPGIADGDNWMDAWLGQMCTPWETITRKTGIAGDRIKAFTYDDEMPTDEETAKLAELWWTTPEGLRRSIEEAKGNA